MKYDLCNFLIVPPAGNCSFSAAEVRVGKTYIKFNNLAAAELRYPDYIQLLIGRDGSTLGIKPGEHNDPDSIPFMCGRTAEDLNGRNRWIRITNKGLSLVIQEKAGWEFRTESNVPKRFFAVPWPEYGGLIFDLTRPLPPKKKTLPLSADDILQTYKLAAQPMSLVPIAALAGNVIDDHFATIVS